MRIYIKYMVSLRCKMVVKAELEKLGLHFGIVELGMVDVYDVIIPENRELLRIGLKRSGLELMDDKKAILIEKIKNVILEMIHYVDDAPKTNYSNYICEKIGQNYTTIATIFSEVAGITIEHYIIAHKIERVKELLLYDELSLKEIAFKLNYSSVAHLSNQFKKVTGLTPTFFKHLKQYKKRIALEDI